MTIAEKWHKELLAKYYAMYNGVIDEEYIGMSITYTAFTCRKLKDWDSYLKNLLDKEYKLRRSTKKLIHIGKKGK